MEAQNYKPLKLIISEDVPTELQQPDIVAPGVNVFRSTEGDVCAYGYAIGKYLYVRLVGTGLFRSSINSDIVTAFALPGISTDIVQDAFDRNVLPLFMQARGQEVLHASAILTNKGVVAFCAVSGTGKSTIAFGLNQSGFPLWADDAVSFDILPDSIISHSLPCRMRLSRESAFFFGLDDPLGDHLLVDIRKRESQSELLLALFVLKRADVDKVKIARLEAASAFLSVLEHAYCFDIESPEDKQRMVGQYLDLAKRIPIYEISFPQGLDHLPIVLDKLRHFIERLST